MASDDETVRALASTTDDPGARASVGAPVGAAESEKARIDRELIELLNELRVALPGVQVLFAFLLVLPFQQRWAATNDLEHVVYVVSFLSTAIASILLIAPSPYHRIRFRDEDKFDLLRFGNRMLLTATAFLAIAVTTAAFLVAEVVANSWAAGVIAAAAGALIIVFWYAIPVVERNNDRSARPHRGSGDR